jgi:DNA primase large subunit
MCSYIISIPRYYLERDQVVAHENIIPALGQVVDEEAATYQTTHIMEVNTDNILLISCACGHKSNEVQSHQCIGKWIHLEIGPQQFLLGLQREEPRWSFLCKATSTIPHPSTRSSRAFDLAMAGIVGWGVNASYLKPAWMLQHP